MKSIAFAPGHITGFFQPIINPSNIYQTGSRGAGFSVSLGAISEVEIQKSSYRIFETYVNDEKCNSPVIVKAIEELLGDLSVKITIKTKLQLPLSQGFGMSAAAALSACYATADCLKIPFDEAVKAAHIAEVSLKTGLGDVISASIGGIEIRKKPGIIPWGKIEKISGNFDVLLCVIDDEIKTHEILNDDVKMSKISEIGQKYTDQILNDKSINSFFKFSNNFSKETKIAKKTMIDLINKLNKVGQSGMCMLGNSVFATGDLDKLKEILKPYNQIYETKIDKMGTRIINKG
jgi:pantoate kinase